MSTTTTARSSTSEGPANGSGSRPAAAASSSFAAFNKAQQDALIERDLAGENPHDPYAGMTKKERRAALKAAKNLSGKFKDYPQLDALRPKEGYVFRSDYFRVDGHHASILSFFHSDAAQDSFPAFWGIDRITSGLDDRVTTVLLEQVRRRGERWVQSHLKTSEKLDTLDAGEAKNTGSRTSRHKQRKIAKDMETIVEEIQNGATYLQSHSRMLVKAPNLEILDDSIERIHRLYIERFGTLKLAPYHGEQRQELSKLFAKNDAKRGKGFHFTSVEYAGSYSLVTNGLNDPTGEYVGYMIGDVNTSAVLLDVDDYKHHIVCADDEVNEAMGRAYVADMWGSKISQAGLLNNRRVVHIVLDGADLDQLGPKFTNLTAKLDMNSGDINMFEMFGDVGDELSIFPAHLEKIVLMAEQAYETTDSDRSIIRGALTKTLTRFYIDKEMWHFNAGDNRDRLRLVDIPHKQVPRLQDIVTYFETQYKAMAASMAKDNEELHAQNILRTVFGSLLDNNGDLFNTHTNDQIDSATSAQRVLYDFSKLRRRGKGVAMAQLVNVVGFAVDSLGLGDTVIFHGTEHIDNRVKDYINTQIAHLYERGGRVAYLYNDIDKMIADADFNKFERADYTIFGSMPESAVDAYQAHLHQDIPPDLRRLISAKNHPVSYLRRSHSNVVFHMDIALGTNPERADRRAELMDASERIRGTGTGISSANTVDSEAASLEEVNKVQKAVSSSGMRRRMGGPKKRGGPRGPVPAPSGGTKRRMTRTS